MQTRTDQRIGSANGLGAGIVPNNAPYGNIIHGAMQYNLQSPTYSQLVNAQLQNGQLQLKDMNSQMDNLTQALSGISFQGLGNIPSGRVAASGLPSTLANIPSLNSVPNNGQLYYQLADGRLIVSNVNTSHGTYQPGNGAYSITPAQAQYLQQTNYHVNQTMPNGQQGQNWNGGQQFPREVPDLTAPRRNSFSSNEETGPHTPFFGAQARTEYQPKVSITDHSPQAWTTPSPEQIGQPFYPQPLLKTPDGQYAFCDLDGMCQRDPPIPRPVPAIFSGEKGRGTLEKSLHNQLNTTNVYIRGLHPDTTDEMLHSYGERFGDIISAKSMLDQHTGLCKGFGFIKYHNFEDGENCIRGFFHWGYEAKWARVSHNEKLKTLGDPENTNLYISGLPLTFNEYTLKAIFDKYDCLSAKILRDPNGLSRGVGFARFATPEICDQIIREYNAKEIGGEGHLLGIRYADTQMQKQLKIRTAESRQFKTNEYNAVVYGPASPYLPSTAAATFPSPLQSRTPGNSGFWPSQAQISPLYQGYPHIQAALQTQVVPGLVSIRNVTENIGPGAGRYSSRIKIESPSAVALAKRAREQVDVSNLPNAEVSSPSIKSGNEDSNNGSVSKQFSQLNAKTSPSKSLQSSPSKSATGKSMLKS